MTGYEALREQVEKLSDEDVEKLRLLLIVASGTSTWEVAAEGIAPASFTDIEAARPESEGGFWRALLGIVRDEQQRRRRPEPPSGPGAAIVDE